MSVSYAVPDSQMRSVSVLRMFNDKRKKNTCQDYLTEKKQIRDKRDKLLRKCMEKLELIHKGKIKKLNPESLNIWIKEYDKYMRMLKLADISQLDWILTKCEKAKCPAENFIMELKNL